MEPKNPLEEANQGQPDVFTEMKDDGFNEDSPDDSSEQDSSSENKEETESR